MKFQVTKEWLADKLAVFDDSAVGAREPRAVDWKAAFEDEAKKFQQETLRTSALMQLLHRLADKLRADHSLGPWSRGCDLCALVAEADALLTKPINADVASAPEKGRTE